MKMVRPGYGSFFLSMGLVLALVLTLGSVGCDDHVVDVTNGEVTAVDSTRYLLELWLDGEEVEILDLRLFDEPSRPFPSGDGSIAYAYRGPDERLLEEGEVADPRLIRDEFNDRGEVDPYFARVDYGLLRLTLPEAAGTLYFFDEGGDVFAQIAVDPLRQSRQSPLMKADDVLGDAIKIVDHGPSNGRADILFLPDGYREEDMDRFRQDVQEMLRGLREHPDYKPMWGDFNFWRQDVRSRQRGINERGTHRDTAFEAGPMGDSGRCFWPSAEGNREIRKLATKVRADYVVVLLNTQTHAGCATSFMTSQAVTPRAAQILAHELGHGLFNLADEYAYAGTVAGQCTTGRPNVSSSARQEEIPWRALLTTDVLPTPDKSEYHRYVGAFEGAGYCQVGRFRPEHTCLMRESAQPMCAVCRYARDEYVIGLEKVRDQEAERQRRREEQEARQAEEEQRRREQEELAQQERERIARCEHVARIDGANIYATAAQISRHLFPEGAQTVILATDREFNTDAMAAGPLASVLKAPFLPAGRTSLAAYTKEEIERLGAQKVIIVGGWTSITPLVTRQLKGMGLEVERVSGRNRFATAREIAREFQRQGSTSKSAFIIAADERSIKDAITAGSLAAAIEAPVLFVQKDKIPRATAQALVELGIEHSYVVGSTARISAAVEAELPGAERVESFHAYDTATALATHALENELTDRSKFFVAHGERPSDAVAASTSGHIILLTGTEELDLHARTFLEKHSREVVIIGDESVISARARQQLCELLPQ